MSIKLISTLLFIASTCYGYSQQLSEKIGTNPTIINPSAVVEMESTTKGFLPPRMSSWKRDAISSPDVGLMVYCTNCGANGELEIFNGTTWTTVLGGASANPLPITRVPTSTGFLVFMTHNLGADTSADPLIPSWKLNGAYFQWGVNPPDTNGDGYKTKPNDGPNGFKAAPTGSTDALANYLGVISWKTALAASGSWNSGSEVSPIKSGSDPCPSGYRVPTQTEFVAISNLAINTWTNVGTLLTPGSTMYNAGKLINGIIFLPAAGYHASGASNTGGERGTGGYYWSSTARPSDGTNYRQMNLRFVSTEINPNKFDFRSEGYSVRCVKQ